MDEVEEDEWEEALLENEEAYDEADKDFGDFETWDEEAFFDDDFTDQGEEPDDLEEAYATYLDARRQFANLKAARGYYPVVALNTGNTNVPLSAQMPRTPKGKSKGNGPPQKGSAKDRAAATKCLKCGQIGHWAASCPMNAARSSSSPTSGGTSPTKRAKTEGAGFMVRDEAVNPDDSLPHIGSVGLYGIQDGGASSCVVGHNTLMKIIDYTHGRGLTADRFVFMATDKMFGLGGDARRPADWSVRLPVYVNGNCGYLETFIIEGNTPLLIGRPILAALKVKMDFSNCTYSVLDFSWRDNLIGSKGEFLMRLDEGLEGDPQGNFVKFDLLTDDTASALDNTEDLGNYINLFDYLIATNRSPPEEAMNAEEEKTPTHDQSELLENMEKIPPAEYRSRPKAHH